MPNHSHLLSFTLFNNNLYQTKFILTFSQSWSLLLIQFNLVYDLNPYLLFIHNGVECTKSTVCMRMWEIIWCNTMVVCGRHTVPVSVHLDNRMPLKSHTLRIPCHTFRLPCRKRSNGLRLFIVLNAMHSMLYNQFSHNISIKLSNAL